MDPNIPLVGGRGRKLLEKYKTQMKDQEDKPEVGTSRVPEQRPVETSESETFQKTKPIGRAALLAQMKRLSLESEESKSVSDIGVAGVASMEGGMRGRGFLRALAKQSKELPKRNVDSPSGSQQKAFSERFEHVEENISEEKETLPVVRRGEIGNPVDITANYITLSLDPGKGVYEYDVRFSPEVDYVHYRYKLVNEHFRTRKGIRCYDGGDKLYMPEKVTSSKLVVDSEHPNEKTPLKIILTFKRQMKLKECGQLYNILFNNCSRVIKLTRLGRQYYDYTLSHQIPQHKLEVWPGYVTAVEEFEGGIHLCCDIRHRVLRTETALNIISNILQSHPQDFKTFAARELLGQCVITRYNNRLYRIDDIAWNQSPLNTFKLKSGEEMTFVDYYKKQYNLEIHDFKQPLLIHRGKGKRGSEANLLCLVPELCNLTGLTDKMRKDMKIMKEISMHTRVTPAQRHYAFKKYLENLKNSTVAQEMLKDWGLQIAKEPVVTTGRILPSESLILKNKAKFSISSSSDWLKYIKNNGVYRTICLRHWLLVYISKHTNLAHSFCNLLVKVGPALGIDIYDPILVSLNDDRIDTYIRGVKKNMTPNIQMVVFICPTPRDDRYSAIKKLCCLDIPIPSQVVNAGSILRENKMRSVVQNIALQINNKLGGASWAVHIPLKNTMICGIDTYHDADKRGCSVGAFVASVDPEYTQWYSKTCIQEPGLELINGLVCAFSHALKKYLEMNDVLPERIIIFRDGVGDGQLNLVQNIEVAQFLDTCKNVSKSYKPKLTFIVVQKRINTKFYQFSNGFDNLVNPEPGCVLDHTVTRRNFYDFFLVSQFVSCGTATPSHYIVLYDTSELKPDLIQRLTYKCCHLYYNWAGTIRVPAPCQYAHKLAYLVGQNVKELPKASLDDKLFYL